MDVEKNVFAAITSTKVPFAVCENVEPPLPPPSSHHQQQQQLAADPPKAPPAVKRTKKPTGGVPAPARAPLMPRPAAAAAAAAVKAPPPRPASAPAPASAAATKTKPMPQVAKQQAVLSKMQTAAEMRQEWAREKAAKTQWAEKQRQEEILAMRQTAQREAEMRKKMLALRKEAEQKKKQQEQEMLAAFVSDRVHAVKEAERLKKERRKQSVLVNKDMLRQSREKQAALAAAKKQEEQTLLATRREDMLKVAEARKAEEQRRRESMVTRGLTAQQQRDVAEQLAQARRDEEAALLQSRREDFLRLTEVRKAEEQRRRESMVGRGVTAQLQRQAAEQAEAARQQELQDSRQYRRYLATQKASSEADEARRTRESLAGRLHMWRSQRTVEAAMDDAKHGEERALLQTKHDNWVDANAHQRRIDERRRASLAFRLDEWRAQKQVAEKEGGERAEAERIEWELRQQEAEDVATYRQACDASRRESLAVRLDKARKDRTVEEALREQQAIIEAEELRLRAEDHAAAAKYRADCDAARRQSLAFRNQQGHIERVREQHERDWQRAVEDEQHALSVAGWRDARAADEAAKEQARRELAEKLVEDRKHHEHDLQRHQAALDALHDELQVRHANWQDDQRAAEADRQRRRQSTVLRLDSWRRERMVEEMLHSQEQLMADEDARLRAQDWEDLQAAKAALKMAEKQDRLLPAFVN